jgi:hypothetical protein
MRLSGLVISSILFVSLTLLAQHSSGGGGGSSGAGGSHGGFSGGSYSSSSGSSHVSSSSASNSSGSSTSSSHPSPSSKLSSSSTNSKANVETDRKSSRSFFHPFRKEKLVENTNFKRPPKCLKEPCAVCPAGSARNGACVVASSSCLYGQLGNGFACGTQGFSSDCQALAGQLAAQRRRMRGQNDPSQNMIYQLLLNQYEQCLRRRNSYAFNGGLLFDTP